MISRIWIINGLLAAALIFCGVQIWDVRHAGPPVFSEESAAADDPGAKPARKLREIRLDEASAYPDVVAKNLFSPERAPAPAEISGTVAEIVEDVKISGEKVVLYGVVMLDGYKKALTNNPMDKTNKYKWVGERDTIGNLAVREIQEDSILLADDAKTYRILLYDPEKATKAEAKSVSKPSAADAQPQVITAGERPAAEEKKPEKDDKYSEKVTLSADGEYEIIDTPLGKIKRKRK